MVRASVAAEKAGVPSASMVCDGFVGQGRATAAGMGMPGLPMAAYPGHINFHTPDEGSFLDGSGFADIVNRAPHPNAAKVWINWFLSREGQTANTRASGVQSTREDIPTDFLVPSTVRQPGVKYRRLNVEMDEEKMAADMSNVIKKLQEIFTAK